MKSWQYKVVGVLGICMLLMLVALVALNHSTGPRSTLPTLLAVNPHSPVSRSTLPAFLAISCAAAALLVFSFRTLGIFPRDASALAAASNLNPPSPHSSEPPTPELQPFIVRAATPAVQTAPVIPIAQIHRIDRINSVAELSLAEIDEVSVTPELPGLREAVELPAKSRERNLFHSILNASPEGILSLDFNDIVEFANPAAAILLGCTASDLLSHDIHRLLHGQRPGGTAACAGKCNILRTLHGRKTCSGEEAIYQRDGSAIPIEFSFGPMIERGHTTGAVVSIRDISQRHAHDRLKDEFVSTVSHELRTPLTSIRGALGLLSTGLLGTLPDKAADLLRIAVTNTDRLVRLINDVLDLERMESGRADLHFQQVDVCDLVQQAVETMRSMAESHGVAITFDNDACPMEADADRIVQVFTNLLSNAIKFSERGSEVSISISPGDEILSINVSDHGRGVPHDKLEGIFDRFQQVDLTDSRQKGGTGLGLAICRSILQQHGGRIWAEPNSPRGTTFRMVVPRHQARMTEDLLSSPLSRALPLLEQSILICDDDPIARSMVRHHLQQHNYQVYEAETGEQALALAHQHHFDAILLDLFMPGMNGWETLNRLKSDAATAAVPVVILSVFSSRPINRKEDIRGWVSKPFNEQSLLAALGAALHPGAGSSRILLVENEDQRAELISANFERAGLAVHRAGNRAEAVSMCQRLRPELMVLNLSLPHNDGMQIVSWLRQHYELHKLPLVVYSGREISNAELDLLSQGPTEFLVRAQIQPAEVELLVLNLLCKQRSRIQDAPNFDTTESEGRIPVV